MPPTPTPPPRSSATQQFPERPFVDPGVVPALYADQARVRRRSRALLDAKIEGRRVGKLLADLLHTAAPGLATEPAVIADIGCGTGHPTRMLAQRFPHARLLAIDASAPMLRAARAHLREHLATGGHRITYLQADFHHLPLADAAYTAAVAVFCLYHSPHPARAITEIARCLTPSGAAVLATKSADSYHELDKLLVTTGLDPDATRRPSLYETADSARLPELTATALTVQAVLHDRHVFRFRDAHHLADYLITVPKHQLPEPVRTTPGALAVELRRRRGDGPTITTSTITCILARKPSRP
ncbi:MAG: methyltransferase domain-containing protein [Streptosporangiaceae bacterium]|nr:methyltransferase domain-containing protein [Streptosporangiaceae bacterium]